MIVLDENFPDSQRQYLAAKGIRAVKIGDDISSKGILDEHIIPLLLRLRHPTLFTQDQGFFTARYCHSSYCIVVIECNRRHMAEFVVRTLRRKELISFRQRTGAVIKVSQAGLTVIHSRPTSTTTLSWLR